MPVELETHAGPSWVRGKCAGFEIGISGSGPVLGHLCVYFTPYETLYLKSMVSFNPYGELTVITPIIRLGKTRVTRDTRLPSDRLEEGQNSAQTCIFPIVPSCSYSPHFTE